MPTAQVATAKERQCGWWRVVLKQKVWKLHKQADFFISVQVSDTTKDEERRIDDHKKRTKT